MKMPLLRWRHVGALFGVFLGIFTFVPLPVSGGNAYWKGGGTDSDWTTSANWNTGAPPSSIDIAYIGSTTNSNSVVQITTGGQCSQLRLGETANTTGTVTMADGSLNNLTALYVGNSGAGVLTENAGSTLIATNIYLGYSSAASQGTYTMNGGELRVTASGARNLFLGYNGSGRFTQTAGVVSNSGTSGNLSVGYNSSGSGRYELKGGLLCGVNTLEIGNYGTGTFVQLSGSTCSVAGVNFCTYASANGTYLMSGGVLNASISIVLQNNNPLFDQSGGTATVGTVDLKSTGGKYHLAGGKLIVTSEMDIRRIGILEIEPDGELVAGNGAIYITRGSGAEIGSLIMKGGKISGAGALGVRSQYANCQGTLQGWGDIPLSGAFNNASRVMADGFGTDHTLAITNYSSLGQQFANAVTETNGWYAQNHGKLLLKSLIVSGNGLQYWGELTSGAFDLVNAVKMNLAGVGGNGSIAGSLYARDHTDVPAYTNGVKIGSIWNFVSTGFTFGPSTLTFRYDAERTTNTLAMSEADLRIYRNNGTSWVRIDAANTGIDTVNKLITASNVTTLGWFAVAESMANLPPAVDAGTNQAVQLPATANLQGTATDDGLPSGVLTTTWSRVSGPGNVTFGNSNALNTTADFSAGGAGTYVLRLTANDGDLVRSDVMTTTVAAASGNTGPTVNAGTNQTVTFRAAATLKGSVTDDGLPSGITNVLWSLKSGPGPVTIGNATVTNTSALFSQDGSYVMQLWASDGELADSNTVTITVSTPSLDCYWDHGGVDSTWANATNWTGDVAPLSLDVAYIGDTAHQNDALALIDGPGATCKVLDLGLNSGTRGTVLMTGGDLTVTSGGGNRTMLFGDNGTGQFTQSGGVFSNSNAGNLSLGTGLSGSGRYDLNGGLLCGVNILEVGNYGTGTFVQLSGSTCSVGGIGFCTYASGVGTYLMSGGVLNVAGTIFLPNNNPLFVQSGGTATVGVVTLISSGGKVRLTGGSFVVTNEMDVRTLGQLEVVQGGELVINNGARLYVTRMGGDTASMSLQGGRISGPGVLGVRSSYINSQGTLQGWGDIPLSGPFYNSGRVIADGFGANQTLAITNYSSFGQSYANGAAETNGWYAQNRGSLLLRSLDVTNCATVTNVYWGAVPSLSNLVNAVQLSFTNVVGIGALSGCLYATNHSRVPKMMNSSRATAAWEFTPTNFTFSSSTLTFRYDATNAINQGLSESALKLYRHDGWDWKPLANSSLNIANKTLIATNVTELGFFAIGNISPNIHGTLFITW